MISGFGGSTGGGYSNTQTHLGGGFPVPFNMPNVLQNLLYGNIDFGFDVKQQDIHTTLKFSYEALQSMLQKSAQQEQILRQKILEDSHNTELLRKLQDMELDRMQATQDFKELLEVMADLLTKEQYEKLLKASNLPV